MVAVSHLLRNTSSAARNAQMTIPQALKTGLGLNGTPSSLPPSSTAQPTASLPLHRDPLRNQDVGFSHANRAFHGLNGLLPAAQESLQQKVARALAQLRSKPAGIEQHLFLAQLRQTNVRLFYALVESNLLEITPLIYTPHVGEFCERYSELYTAPEGLFISLKDQGNIKAVLENWREKGVKVAVVTDGSRILGLGDLGLGGIGISCGKLALYVAAGGVKPEETLPIVLDMGTDNEKLLADPLYLGLREKRRPLSDNIAFLDEFMVAFREVFPSALVQFEDFSSEAAFLYLDRYQGEYCMFNDDVQGTGSVILGGFINAAVKSAEASGRALGDQKIVFLGAGSAAVGVAKQLISFFTRNGVSEAEAVKRFWLVDTKGLVTADRGDKLAEHKKFFQRFDNDGQQFKTLKEVVDYVQPTALIGLSTTRGAFDEATIRKMAELNPRPIVFPLSNPLTKCELTFEDALSWTNGKVIFASGSPFSPSTFGGVKHEAGQGNNMYVFPGIGLGASLSGATKISDRMIEEASLALADSLNAQEKADDLLYPRIERIREISAHIAVRVIETAQAQGLDSNVALRGLTKDALFDFVVQHQYRPAVDVDAAHQNGNGVKASL